MKKLIVSIIGCTLLFTAAFSQTENKKITLFNEIETLRLQYRLDGFYLNSIQNFGEGSKYEDLRINLSKAKIKIDGLEKAYIILLSKRELKLYTDWKSNQDIEDKRQDLGWWYIAVSRSGC